LGISALTGQKVLPEFRNGEGSEGSRKFDHFFLCQGQPVTELQDRLVRCFSSVFPTLSEAEIRASNVVPLFDLDSLAGVTLVTLIDQVFGVNVELPDLLELGSFGAILQFLQKPNSSQAPRE
jgi:acyl carrier protein